MSEKGSFQEIKKLGAFQELVKVYDSLRGIRTQDQSREFHQQYVQTVSNLQDQITDLGFTEEQLRLALEEYLRR